MGKVLADSPELGGLGNGGHDGVELGSADEVHGGTELLVLDVVLDQVADLATGVPVQEVTDVVHESVHLGGQLRGNRARGSVAIGHRRTGTMRTTLEEVGAGELRPGGTDHRWANLGTVLRHGQASGESSEEAQGNVEFHFRILSC